MLNKHEDDFHSRLYGSPNGIGIMHGGRRVVNVKKPLTPSPVDVGPAGPFFYPTMGRNLAPSMARMNAIPAKVTVLKV